MADPSLERLLAPRHVAVVGGEAAAFAIRQSRRLAYEGVIWPVNPARTRIEGLRCFPDVASLPEAPDAALVAVPREATVEVVGDLAKYGAGGAVCHAAGFAEVDAYGQALQRDLVEAAADMPLIGPNCIGLVNYLDGVALWPDEHGGERVGRGVAIITQSGNVAQNLSMQRRALPIAILATAGNAAATGIADLVTALVRDERITTIGLHLEGVPDVAALARAAALAHERKVAIVVLKSGTSDLGAQANASHTSALAGSDTLTDALFERLGLGRVRDVETFVETLKLLHVHGAPAGSRLVSASCSGGEAALVADLAAEYCLEMPSFDATTRRRLSGLLGDRVTVANPLDYQTYIWGDRAVQEECFGAFLGAPGDLHLLVLDRPRADRCAPDHWDRALDAYVAASSRADAATAVVSLLPEGIPEPLACRLLDRGVAPLHGLASAIRAIGVAAGIGRAHRRSVPTVAAYSTGPRTTPRLLEEYEGKRLLSAAGVSVPTGAVASARDAGDVATRIGFPVVAKVASGLAHKSDAGGVRLGLADATEVRAAVEGMGELGDRFLIEQHVDDAVAELVVGVRADDTFGPTVTIGVGGVLVELLDDAATLLAPVSEDDVARTLRTLRGWPLLDGFRGRARGDIDAAVRAIAAIARCALDDRLLVEIEVNPLLVRPAGRGVVVADALVRRVAENDQPRRR